MTPNNNIEIAQGNYDSETLQQYLNTTYFYESGVDNYLKHIKFTIDTYTLKSNFQIIFYHYYIPTQLTFIS